MGATFHVDDPNAPRPNLPRRAGAVLAALGDGGATVLMERRSDSGLWGLIGGSLDDDESILTGLRREVGEETGRAIIGEPDLLGVFSNPTRILSYPDGNVFASITVGFVGTLEDGPLTCSHESTELAYRRWEEIDPAGVPATHRAIVAAARRWAAGDRRPHVD